MIRAGEYDRALQTAAESSLTRPTRAFRRSLRDRIKGALSPVSRKRLPPIDRWVEQSAVTLLERRFPGPGALNREIRDYFVFRPGHAEHVAAMGLASVIRADDAPVLDLGAGAGHMAAHFCAAGIPVTAIDQDFFLLLIGRLIVAPEARFVCCDLEEGLPFADQFFGATICVNTFHFVRNKAHLLGSLGRVLRQGSPLFFCALRQSHNPGAFRNFALPPSGYARLFEEFEPRFFSTDDVVDRYLDGDGPRPGDARVPDDLLRATFVEIAGHNGGHHRAGRSFDQWPHALGTLGVNPVYQPVPSGDQPGIQLRLSPPSELFAADSRHLLERLPAETYLAPEILEDLEAGRRSDAMQDLIRSMVLVQLPPGYSGQVEHNGPA